jgi:multiple sugar transport system substrate-binding protein
MKRITYLFSLVLTAAFLLAGCNSAPADKQVSLDPRNPVTVTIWHYYNGAALNAFEDMVRSFNETVGKQEGVIVEGSSVGNPSELEKAVVAAINKDVGSGDVPNIFASYADTAYAMEQKGVLANLDDYLSEEELEEYLDSFITEGRIGLNGELRIFPIAKATEALIVNETDWLPFAAENNVSYDDLGTMEGVVRVAELYYNWSGKAFFGRDAMANLFIIASKQFGTEIFQADKGEVTINVDEGVMRRIWDHYYVPYINGYFTSYGRFRSDDIRVGDIIAYVGATSSAAYFPQEVTVDGDTYPIEAKVLPLPLFEGGGKVMVQQGAGMVVTESTPQEEYASIVFLKWFTEPENNIEFSALSGYMPVKKAAADYDSFIQALEDNGRTLDKVTNDTLHVVFEEMKTSELYANKAFDGGVAARSVLERFLQDKAVADKEAVLQAIEDGSTREQAVTQFNTEDSFRAWLSEFEQRLNETVAS